jgi:hypothetical protein
MFALILIFAFIAFIAIIMVLVVLAPSVYKVENIQIIGAILGPWVGAVVGYYFGEKPVAALLRSVANLSEFAEWANRKQSQDEYYVKEAKTYLRSSINDIKNLVRTPSISPELAERLTPAADNLQSHGNSRKYLRRRLDAEYYEVS